MPFHLTGKDITLMQVDAIVNAANPALQMGGGVCGAIFSAAGARALQAACDRLAPIQTGEAVLTSGFALPAKYIIHTAGPIYRGGTHGEEAQLRACYRSSLSCAARHGCSSIAFPLISSGIYGYPKPDALRVATAAIQEFLVTHDMDVSLVVLDHAALSVSEALLGAVNRYLGTRHLDPRLQQRRTGTLTDDTPMVFEVQQSRAIQPSAAPTAVPDHIVKNLDEPFSTALLRLIDQSGKSDAEIYKRANIDRRLFSKIRGNLHYTPSKPTVLAFAVALELTLPQTRDLLARAGFALSRSRKFDVIVEYFLANGRYDIFEINEVLFYYDQALLGG